MKDGAGLVGGLGDEKALYPVCVPIVLVGGGGVAGAHHQKVPDSHLPDPGMSVIGSILREIAGDGGVKVNLALACQKTYGNT